MDVTDQSHMV
jgi:hypothetical protein